MNHPSSRRSRRDFLKSAAVLGAAGSLPLGLHDAFAQDPAKTPEPEKPKPKIGDGIRIGLIGCGGQGTGDLQNAARLGATVTALCDVDESHLGKLKQKYDKAQTFTDFRKMLESKELDAVICATPDHWHTLVSLAAMRAGKDIYCEKPLTLTIDEGKHLVKVEQETKRILQTGTQQRSSLYFRRPCEAVRNNRIGKLKHIDVWVPAGMREGPYQPSEVPPGFDYDTWLGQAPKTPYIKERTHMKFRYWWEYSAGTITDWGAHHNDIALWATGYERSGPISAEGKVLKEPIPGGLTVPSEFQIDWTYENGVTHRCMTTTDDNPFGGIVNKDGQRNGIRFVGENGWIWAARGSMNASDREILKDNFGPNDQRLYLSNDHMANFLECVKTRKEPICPAVVGHRSATMCHLGAISVRLGRKINWDPKKEEFVNDPEAQQMASRPQRAPFNYDMVGGA
jgi:predicted dehydrogenase